MIISPSLLSADFADLKQDIQRVELGGANWLHYDVMDGHFVPNISFGYSILKDIRNVTDLFLDVHLMISEPMKYIDQFITAGADLITFHYEAYTDTTKIAETIQQIKNKNKKAGISIKPATPIDVITPFLKDLDVVLVMSVEPGFGGQSFKNEALDKIKQLKTIHDENNYQFLIEVDGGINPDTAKLCKEAGVDVIVAGSYIFNHENVFEAIASLQ